MWILHSELEGKKAPSSSPAAWYSASVGPHWGALSFRLRPRTCTDSQDQRLPKTPARRLPSPRAGDSAWEPAWSWTRGGRPPARPPGPGYRASAVCGAGASLCPPLLPPHARLPSRRSGWVSGGRVPIMNEQSRDRAEQSRAPACPPAARPLAASLSHAESTRWVDNLRGAGRGGAGPPGAQGGRRGPAAAHAPSHSPERSVQTPRGCAPGAAQAPGSWVGLRGQQIASGINVYVLHYFT